MITLTPEAEAQLHTVATQRGLSAEEALRLLIAEAADVVDAVTGLHQGTAEIAAGDWISLEELWRDMETQAQLRRGDRAQR